VRLKYNTLPIVTILFTFQFSLLHITLQYTIVQYIKIKLQKSLKYAHTIQEKIIAYKALYLFIEMFSVHGEVVLQR